MPLNFLNTTVRAQVARPSRPMTTAQLQAAEERIGTSYRGADATDDGPALRVAQRLRSEGGTLTTADAPPGDATGLLTTALSGLTTMSDRLTDAKSLLVQIADASISQDQRNQYVASYRSLVQRVADAVDGSADGGQALHGAVAGRAKTVTDNESGAARHPSGNDVSGLANTLAALIGSTFSRSAAGVDAHGTGNAKIGAQTTGLDALVDIELSKESAQLRALQIRQQLGEQTLSLVNQAPQTILSLFK